MNPWAIAELQWELWAYEETLVEDLVGEERRRPTGLYFTGLPLDGECKSIEPMASRLVDSPFEIEAMLQRLQPCVTVSDWSNDELRRKQALRLDAELPDIEALVIDNTGFPKKGKASVDLARQSSGPLGRTYNCRVATSLHIASAIWICLPQALASDLPRRKKVRAPQTVVFREKWGIVHDQLDDAIAWGVR